MTSTAAALQATPKVGDAQVLLGVAPPEVCTWFDTSEAGSSLLDSGTPPLETSAAPPPECEYETYGSIDHHDGFSPVQPRETVFRHSGWKAARRRVFASLKRTGASCRRIQHFSDCGSALWLDRDGTVLSLSCNHCHDRLCLPCQKSRQNDLIEGIILKMLDSVAPCRFVTLTLKHQDAPLAVQLERLVSCFKSLRSHPEIRPHMAGGVWFIEVKLSKDASRWHPHLHVIVSGEFIDAKRLSQCWLQVTGDSYITDIRSIGSIKERAAYVTKYATKPLHNEVTKDPAKLDEFVTAIKGRRLYQCFGSWSKAKQTQPPPKGKITRIGRLSSIWEDACNGDIQALVLMHQATAKWPKLSAAFPLPHSRPPPSYPCGEPPGLVVATGITSRLSSGYPCVGSAGLAVATDVSRSPTPVGRSGLLCPLPPPGVTSPRSFTAGEGGGACPPRSASPLSPAFPPRGCGVIEG